MFLRLLVQHTRTEYGVLKADMGASHHDSTLFDLPTLLTMISYIACEEEEEEGEFGREKGWGDTSGCIEAREGEMLSGS